MVIIITILQKIRVLTVFSNKNLCICRIVILYKGISLIRNPSLGLHMRRVKDQDDPRRCRATAADGGQCWNETIHEDSQRCAAHGGRDNSDAEIKDYLTEQFERRVKLNYGEVDEIKLLKENLMRLNSMIAVHANNVTDEASMLANSMKIIELTVTAERLTTSLKRLEQSSNTLLAKPALMAWGQLIVQAVDEMVRDKYEGWEEDLIDLSMKVADIIVQARNVEKAK